jgi:hypothetical protein
MYVKDTIYENFEIDESSIVIEDAVTLLHYACSYANLPLIVYAIALNAGVNSCDAKSFNRTPLIRAIQSVSY